MGQLISAISSVNALDNKLNAATGSGQSMPQKSPMPQAPNPDPTGILGTPAAQAATPDQAYAPPQGNAISINDLYDPSLTQPTAPQAQAPAVPDNPYTSADNNTPADIAQSVGTPDQQPITVTGDSWQPKKESKLGRIVDTILAFDGKAPVFQNRTDDANMETAMKGFQKDPETAIARIRQFNPQLAWQMSNQLSVQRANQALEADRVQQRQDQGRDRLGRMLGAVVNSKTPEAIYDKQLPLFRKYAETYGLDPTELPDKYDADTINALRSAGISTYDQGRLTQEAINSQNTENYRQTMIGLNKLGKQISIANTNETVRANHAREASFDQQHVLEARQQASKEGVTLNSAFAPYTNLKPGQYVVSPDKTQVLMKRPDGYIYKFPLQKRPDGSKYIDLDNPIIRGTTVDSYMSK